jgi:hypothetical protein
MKINTFFGPITLKKGIPEDFIKEGFYIIYRDEINGIKDDYLSFGEIYVDELSQEYKLSVVGWDRKYSEDLWRYKDWYFSDKLVDKFNYLVK